MSVIIRNLAGQEMVRWNVFAFGLSQIGTGSAGRQRYAFTPTAPANNVMEIQRDPALFPANVSNNPQTDSRVEIDGFPTTVFPVLAEDINNRTVTLTLDYTEGAGMYVWVQQTVQGTAQKRLVSHILTDSTGLQIGRINYVGCFPISYQQFTGFGQVEKLKERVTLSYDTRNVN